MYVRTTRIVLAKSRTRWNTTHSAEAAPTYPERYDSGSRALIPRLNFPLNEDKLGLGIGLDELLGKGNGGRVGRYDARTVKDLVHILVCDERPTALAIGASKLALHQLVPHLNISMVGTEEKEGVPAVHAEYLHGYAHGYRSAGRSMVLARIAHHTRGKRIIPLYMVSGGDGRRTSGD
jgi:hypothetical protein